MSRRPAKEVYLFFISISWKTNFFRITINFEDLKETLIGLLLASMVVSFCIVEHIAITTLFQEYKSVRLIASVIFLTFIYYSKRR